MAETSTTLRLAAVLVCLSLSGLSLSGEAQAGSLPAPPGTMVDVGGYRLHFDCTPPAERTVLLEAGGGAFSLSWKLVQDRLADVAGVRVCSYDRAGLGWSEPSPEPHSVEREVGALEAALDRLEVTDELILVGHSYGGFLVRLFAATYPERVAGLVYVDPNAVPFFDRYPDVAEELAAPRRGFTSAPNWLARRVARGQLAPFADALDEEDLETLLILSTTKKHRRAQADFGRAFQATVDTLREARVPRHIEAIVITRGERFPHDPWTTEERELAWREAHESLLVEVDRATHWIAETSGHAVNFDQPELVVRAILHFVTPEGSAEPQGGDRGR